MRRRIALITFVPSDQAPECISLTNRMLIALSNAKMCRISHHQCNLSSALPMEHHILLFKEIGPQAVPEWRNFDVNPMSHRDQRHLYRLPTTGVAHHNRIVQRQAGKTISTAASQQWITDPWSCLAARLILANLGQCPPPKRSSALH
ncbi:hypothetical protein F2P81_020307 [Scophthalmus maximus]|uniref:Uncharacterized protein n=1 Tax=Scophthalmus maximus TaxID=52904 RepID=A0A6A4RXL5_SCOMX|nr:hypothetical protein F2P81_020307 [Scophthalmus maximus]